MIIAAFLLLIVPTFLSMSSGGYLWKHVLALLPAKITDFSFTSYLVFRVGGLIVTWPTAAMALTGRELCSSLPGLCGFSEASGEPIIKI